MNTHAPAALPDAVSGDGRRALARFNASAAMLLLVAGGMVTSTASGLAVPDWPLSYGSWLPSMVGGIFFEHGHRMLATLVGFTILVMAVWTQWKEPRAGVRKLAWWTLFAVILQGVLGGVTVLFGLPVWVSAAHATLGQSVFCALVVTADLTGEPAPRAASAPSASLRRMGLAAVAALWTQLVLGAVLRHGGAGIRWHLMGAAVAAPLAGWFGARALLERREPELARPAGALLLLLGVQLVLGLATADFRTYPDPRADYAMIGTATTHLAVGALLLGVAVLLTFRLFRLRED